MKKVKLPAPVFFSEEEKEKMRQNPDGYQYRNTGNEQTAAKLKELLEAREKELKECVGEMCELCRTYRLTSDESCKWCKWKAIREGGAK